MCALSPHRNIDLATINKKDKEWVLLGLWPLGFKINEQRLREIYD